MAQPTARVVVMTAPDHAVAETLVRALVDAGLIACGNIVPGLTSIYRWQGAVERETEVLVLAKTRNELVDRLIERVAELHPYDVPEVLVLSVEAGYRPYLDWIDESTAERTS